MKALRAVAEDVWEFDEDLWMPGRIHFNARCTVVRMGDGRLWVHSPVSMSEELVAELAELGEVGWLVAPNLLHHSRFAPAADLFPDAKRWGVPGLPKRRKDLTFDGILSETPTSWSDEIETIAVEGAGMVNEHVFFHHPTGSLICADLMFNIHEVENWWTTVILRMAGAWQRPTQSRSWRMFTRNRSAAGASCATIVGRPIQRVVMGHGRIIDGPDAHAITEHALSWMLNGRPAPQLVAE